MNNVTQCPQCKTYIFGTFCGICKQDVSIMQPKNDIPDFLKDIFGGPCK